MAINSAVADGSGLSPAHVMYSTLLTMPINVLAGVCQLAAAEDFVANWEQIAKKFNQQLIRA